MIVALRNAGVLLAKSDPRGKGEGAQIPQSGRGGAEPKKRPSAKVFLNKHETHKYVFIKFRELPLRIWRDCQEKSVNFT